jgi:anti-sigma B factor antagonist
VDAALSAIGSEAVSEDILSVEVSQPTAGVLVVRCVGEIDMASCNGLADRIDAMLTSELHLLRVDLTGVSFMDSTGVHCLIRIQQRCANLGARLEVAPSERVLRLFQMTGMNLHIASA